MIWSLPTNDANCNNIKQAPTEKLFKLAYFNRAYLYTNHTFTDYMCYLQLKMGEDVGGIFLIEKLLKVEMIWQQNICVTYGFKLRENVGGILPVEEMTVERIWTWEWIFLLNALRERMGHNMNEGEEGEHVVGWRWWSNMFNEWGRRGGADVRVRQEERL